MRGGPGGQGSTERADPHKTQPERPRTGAAVPAAVALVRLQVLVAAVRAVERDGSFSHELASGVSIAAQRGAERRWPEGNTVTAVRPLRRGVPRRRTAPRGRAVRRTGARSARC